MKNLQNITLSFKLSNHHLECVQLSTLLNKLFVVHITMDLNFKTLFL